MDSATIMLKARLLANVKMAGKPKGPKGQGKTQVKAKIHANEYASNLSCPSLQVT
jgi:hypothetical protein